tara:strand:+ start:2755 stop:3732 length:978 start_codon:yes stop_codon:yes gene_type:complete
MKNSINLIVAKNENGLRVDQFVSKMERNYSRSKIKVLILNKKLKINSKDCYDPSKKIFVGDEINIEIPRPENHNLKPFDYKLNIVYEDKELLVINKNPDIQMHPGAGNYDKTLVNALIKHKKDLSETNDKLRPGIVHRIDKDTSGLVVVAKNSESHKNLASQFNKHKIERKYKALVWGKLRPSSGIIETLITRSTKNRQLMAVSMSKGKRAVTKYKTLEVFENKSTPTLSLVECKLETGRTHQIRVHMSYKGNYIVGDKKYKKKFKKLKNIDVSIEENIKYLNRQFLHAATLGFTHPVKNERMEFKSTLPPDLLKLLKTLRNTSK